MSDDCADEKLSRISQRICGAETPQELLSILRENQVSIEMMDELENNAICETAFEQAKYVTGKSGTALLLSYLELSK